MNFWQGFEKRAEEEKKHKWLKPVALAAGGAALAGGGYLLGKKKGFRTGVDRGYLHGVNDTEGAFHAFMNKVVP